MKICLSILLFCVLPYQLDAQTPDLVFANSMGAANQDFSNEMVLDNDGNAYLIGGFNNTVDFDPSAGVANLTASGTDIFVAKYNADGDYVWAFSIGGGGFDVGSTITIDSDNNIYIGGSFINTVDFDPGIGNAPLVSTATGDGFIAKYDTDGNYQWAICMEGTGYSGVDDITLDNSGNICAGGYFSTTVDFNPGIGTANLTATGTHDLFIAKYTSAGVYTWAYKISGTASKDMSAIGTDNAGNIFISGYFNETADFNPGAGVANLTGGTSAADIFMAKYSSSGTYIWAKSIGNPMVDNFEGVEDMVVEPSGTFYITGYAGGNTIDFDPGAGVANLSGPPGSHAFIGKYTTDGNYLWAFGLGAPGANSRGRAVRTDALDNVYMAGNFAGTVDIDPSGSTTTLASPVSHDMFVVSFTSAGTLNWGEQIGGASFEAPYTLALNNNGSIWLSGIFSGTVDFDPDLSNAYELTSAGTNDAFVARYQYCTIPAINETAHQDVSCSGGSDGNATIDVSGNAPFTFTWTPNISSNETLSGVEAGTYECLVTSTCGTENTITVTITEPAAIVPSIVSQTNLICNGESTGEITASATGGTGALSFEWQPGGLTTETINNLSAGDYTCTVTDQNGCEEDLLVSITEPAAITFTQNINLCYGEEITVGASTYSSNGTYQDVLTALNGCDSTVTTNLTIQAEINITVSQSDITLTAVQTAADYQWIDCNNGNAPLTGETNQSFTATTNGFYAVVITQGSCSDTSACMLLTDVSVGEYTPAILVLYPNPASDVLFITCQVEIIRAELIDMQGKTIQTIIGPVPQIYLQQVAPGTYYIRLVTENNEVLTRKITKQNL